MWSESKLDPPTMTYVCESHHQSPTRVKSLKTTERGDNDSEETINIQVKERGREKLAHMW